MIIVIESFSTDLMKLALTEIKSVSKVVSVVIR